MEWLVRGCVLWKSSLSCQFPRFPFKLLLRKYIHVQYNCEHHWFRAIKKKWVLLFNTDSDKNNLSLSWYFLVFIRHNFLLVFIHMPLASLMDLFQLFFSIWYSEVSSPLEIVLVYFCLLFKAPFLSAVSSLAYITGPETQCRAQNVHGWGEMDEWMMVYTCSFQIWTSEHGNAVRCYSSI